jgi:hypothetical protein
MIKKIDLKRKKIVETFAGLDGLLNLIIHGNFFAGSGLTFDRQPFQPGKGVPGLDDHRIYDEISPVAVSPAT